jgi:hypothetical protein
VDRVKITYPLVDLLALEGLERPLVLRFAVESPNPGGTGSKYLATMAPVEFRIGSEPEPLALPPAGIEYGGGDGLSCSAAVVVAGGSSTSQGIAAERSWLRQKYPGHRFVRQGAVPNSGAKSYDLLTIQVQEASGVLLAPVAEATQAPTGAWKELTICFDITGFFGKP